MANDDQTARANAFLSTVLTLLAASVSSCLLLNVAELQSAALIVVRAQAPESTGLAVDVGLVAIAAAGVAPILLLAVAVARRWTLLDFIGWLFAVVLAVVLAASVVAFRTYRYWRDHQPVAILSPTVDPIFGASAISGDIREMVHKSFTKVVSRQKISCGGQ